jgi:hypothetical protein
MVIWRGLSFYFWRMAKIEIGRKLQLIDAVRYVNKTGFKLGLF